MKKPSKPSLSKHSQTTLAFILEMWIGVAVIVLSLLLFLKLAHDVLQQDIISFDMTIINTIYHFRTTELTQFMLTITFLGGGFFLIIATLIIIMLLWRNRHKKDALIFSFLLFFGAGLNLILKEIFQRARPTLEPLVNEPTYSFPSGHAMNSFIFYACLSYFIFRKLKPKPLGNVLIFLSALLVLLIGVSRIYLGAHYPSDVIAGYTAGLLWFVGVLIFEKTVQKIGYFKIREVSLKE